ncbi:MAG: hypothetical protein A3I05_06465 [Deltaproteobacteria bacterium RIFCSPLOWO2_02_FULL_44_10]|nr:MAG: hypothetical protein A3C46_06670 [Deltaproteobacteria bacterium RIFCSPHIGHO2_02_FULL_44_16]OGQ46681.1 MAG: hypothetical protein A3I05_06465 [Deltaproteobacteria bacterium RIFCSPLOWO2_02_FULL_44_10]
MKKNNIFALSTLFFLLSTPAFAKKTTYIVTNQRFDYVKLGEISLREAETRGVSHPVEVDEEKIRKALASLKFSRESFWKKSNTFDRKLFSDEAVNFLSLHLPKAFRQAKTTEEVVFSYLDKDPIVILRNDRLTIASVWVHGNELHLQFKKLFAKVSGDTDKRGNEVRAAAKAKGLRIALQIQPGQRLSQNDEKEVILDLNHDFSSNASFAEEDNADEKTTKTPRAEKASTDKTFNTKQRLEQIEQLRKDKFISQKEYDEKRKEILKDL